MKKVNETLLLIVQYKNDMTDMYKPHFCSRSYCNPETLYHLTRKGDQTIFLCKFRQYHICDESHCHCASCPISGICWGTEMFSSYASDDFRTWNVGAEEDDDPTVYIMPGYEPKVQNVANIPYQPEVFVSKLNRSDASAKVEQVIEKLLYSPMRSTLNDEYYKQKDKVLNRERDAYISHCVALQRPVNRIQLTMISDRHDSGQPPLHLLERDQSFISYLVNCVLQVCETVERYGRQAQSKVCVISITLGVLYTMRQGYALDGISLLPMIPLLRDHLPIMNHLSKFGLEKQKYTKGHQMIVYSYDVALRKGVSIAELSLRPVDSDLKLQKLGKK